jgi:hypothetical protein
MAAIRAKNEKVRAVGNMNVNARGDILDSNNNIIADANKRVNAMYQKTMQNPQASKRSQSGPNAQVPASATTATVANELPKAPVEEATKPLVQTIAIEADEVYNGAPADFGDDEPNPEK